MQNFLSKIGLVAFAVSAIFMADSPSVLAASVKACKYADGSRCLQIDGSPSEVIAIMNGTGAGRQMARGGGVHPQHKKRYRAMQASYGGGGGYWRVPNTYDNTAIKSTGSGYIGRDDGGPFTARCSKVRYFENGPYKGYCHYCSAKGVRFTIVSRYGMWGSPTGFWMGHVK